MRLVILAAVFLAVTVVAHTAGFLSLAVTVFGISPVMLVASLSLWRPQHSFIIPTGVCQSRSNES